MLHQTSNQLTENERRAQARMSWQTGGLRRLSGGQATEDQGGKVGLMKCRSVHAAGPERNGNNLPSNASWVTLPAMARAERVLSTVK